MRNDTPRPPTILNVNDDDAARYLLTHSLLKAAFIVVEGKTGAEALSLLRGQPGRQRPDLVVLDVNMPDMDGFEVCRRIKADPETAWIPVLHVSASLVGVSDRARGLDGGADGYLVQPVEPAELIATVHALLRLTRAEERTRLAAKEWQAVFDAIRDGVCLLDAAGSVQRCNRAMTEHTGLPAARIVGRPWVEVVADAFPDAPLPTVPGVGEHAGVAFEVTAGRRWLRFTTGPVPGGPDATQGGSVFVVADVTDIRDAALRQRRFVREMLMSVTEGRLCLCETESDLPDALPRLAGATALTPKTLRALRHQAEDAATKIHMPEERIHDLLTGTGEAAMNAVRHAGGGEAWVGADAKAGFIQVWVRDTGSGIRDEDIHRATLEKGYSSVGTLGHGFFLMLRSCDRTYLLTGADGTTVVLEQDITPTQPGWLGRG
jgi:PAS domain S-box-containing protein